MLPRTKKNHSCNSFANVLKIMNQSVASLLYKSLAFTCLRTSLAVEQYLEKKNEGEEREREKKRKDMTILMNNNIYK